MTSDSPILLWFRRDLRLSDHPALHAACSSGRPVIPVFIHDDVVAKLGAAPKWRLGQALERFGKNLSDNGSRLILGRGSPVSVLDRLVEETGAESVWWTRAYDPEARARDTHVKSALKTRGIDARSFGGSLLFEPWTVSTKTGGYYRVFSPYWRSVRGLDVDLPLPAPAKILVPEHWPESENLADWQLGSAMRRGASVVARHSKVGESAAADALEGFVQSRVSSYGKERDFPAENATSGMAEFLSLGEISPHQVWHRLRLASETGTPGTEAVLRQLVWREFAYHLLYHTPHLTTRSWRPEWDSFPWRTDPDNPDVTLWKQGRTGIRFVDAAMREMYVTGRMHNRARMIVASFLTKHLLTHWRVGMDWFAECLTDWDPANNAMGWQWVAGSGPDAAPYFRIFNPDTQLDKFDPQHRYVQRWIAEGQETPHDLALSYFDAAPRSWNIGPEMTYPRPVISLADGRNRASDAYSVWSKSEKRREILPDG